jgi:hypothetical protein
MNTQGLSNMCVYSVNLSTLDFSQAAAGVRYSSLAYVQP